MLAPADHPAGYPEGARSPLASPVGGPPRRTDFTAAHARRDTGPVTPPLRV